MHFFKKNDKKGSSDEDFPKTVVPWDFKTLTNKATEWDFISMKNDLWKNGWPYQRIFLGGKKKFFPIL